MYVSEAVEKFAFLREKKRHALPTESCNISLEKVAQSGGVRDQAGHFR